MAVRLERIDVLVPVRVIEDRYPGGLAQCLSDHLHLIGRRMWHDGRLLRDGALDPAGARRLVEGWQAIGVEALQWVGRRPRWKELCVVDTANGGATAPCAWLALDLGARIAWLRGGDPGEPVGRG
jgi:hypothetical protein